MFKVGDKVLMKNVSNDWTDYDKCIGKTGIITSIEKNDPPLYYIDYNKYYINFFDEELELVRTETFSEMLLKQIYNNEN